MISDEKDRVLVALGATVCEAHCDDRLPCASRATTKARWPDGMIIYFCEEHVRVYRYWSDIVVTDTNND